jgi:hypothetical protein
MRMRMWLVRAALPVCAMHLACTADETPADESCSALVDPSDTRYGSYAELAAAWRQWASGLDPTPSCLDPVADPTGQICGHGQDTQSPVFFLAGTWSGGVVRRDGCVVPAGKALFFPLINASFDTIDSNPPPPDAELMQRAADAFGVIQEGSYTLQVDGCAIENPVFVEPTAFVVSVPPPPNAYSCDNMNVAAGDYPGYTAGAFALLKPLATGDHVVTFTASLPVGFSLDVAYDPLRME